MLQAERDAASGGNVSQIEQDQKNRKLAGLWTWPLPEQSSDEYLAAKPTSSIPETLTRQSMQDGRRLVQCLEGVEGQVWEDGCLMASRWWPGAPSQSQWVTFLRSARLKTDEISLEPPRVVEVPWRTNLPFARGAVDAVQVFATPMHLLVAVGVIFGALLVYNGVQYTRYTQTLKNLQAQVIARKEVVSDVLKERNKAVLNLRSIEKMGGIGSSTALLYGLAGTLEKIEGDGLEIVKLTLLDNQLGVRIKGEPENDGASLVKELEADPALAQVSVNFTSGNVIDIKAVLEAPQ